MSIFDLLFTAAEDLFASFTIESMRSRPLVKLADTRILYVKLDRIIVKLDPESVWHI